MENAAQELNMQQAAEQISSIIGSAKEPKQKGEIGDDRTKSENNKKESKSNSSDGRGHNDASGKETRDDGDVRVQTEGEGDASNLNKSESDGEDAPGVLLEDSEEEFKIQDEDGKDIPLSELLDGADKTKITRKIKVDGKTVEVTLADLEKNYSGQKKWESEFFKLNQEKKNLLKDRHEVESQKTRALETVLEPLLKQDLDKMATLEQDIATLRRADPNGFTYHDSKTNRELLGEYLTDYTLQKQDVEAKYNEYILNQQQSQVLAQEQLNEFVGEQYEKLLEKDASYADRDLVTFRHKCYEEFKSLGMEEEEALRLPWKASNFILMENLISLKEKANKWDALQAKKPTIGEEVKKKPTFIKSGASKSKATLDKEKMDKDLSKLRNSNNIRDAAAAFRNFI